MPTHAVLKSPAGQVINLEELSKIPEFEVEQVWYWSDDHHPRVGESLDGIEAISPDPEIELRFSVPDSKRPENVRVLAAPTAMWEELPEAFVPEWPFDLVQVDKAEQQWLGSATIPVLPGLPWRFRIVGDGWGSWWQDVKGLGSPSIELKRSLDRSIAISFREEPAAAGEEQAVRVRLRETWQTGRPRRLTSYLAVDEVVTLPSLIDGGELWVAFQADGFLPTVIESRPSSLPRGVTLDRGTLISGRFVDADDTLLAGVVIEADSWLAGKSTLLYRPKAESGADGRWTIGPVPSGAVALVWRKDGLATGHRDLRVGTEAEDIDLGDCVMTAVRETEVLVVDEQDLPIAGATVEALDSFVSTDGEGKAILPDLPRTGLMLGVDAPGFLAAEVPVADNVRVVLSRAGQLLAQLVDQAGVPVAGSFSVEYGDSTLAGRFAAGDVEVEVEPDSDLTLLLKSTSTKELRLAVAGLAPGETRDLGRLVADSGVRVLGVLLDAEEGDPISGARVWAPRPDVSGPLFAWSGGDLLQSRSLADGTFELAGLEPGSRLELTIDAPGFARTMVQVEADEESVDLGEIGLPRGSRVEITTDEGADVVRIDLGGQWLEHEMLTAPASGGLAIIEHVPPGQAWVTVLDQDRLLCEKKVRVPTDDRLEVSCLDHDLEVAGRVLIGGELAGSGVLTWIPEHRSTVAAVITNEQSRGAVRQMVHGAGKPQVEVSVDDQGRFASRDLSADSWSVRFIGASGVSQPIEIELASSADDLELHYLGGAIAGVVTSSAEPVTGARVTSLDGRLHAITGDDGRFRFAPVPSRSYRLVAQKNRLSSEIRMIETSAPGEEVEVELRLREDDRILLIEIEEGGSHAVFVEDDLGFRTVMTSGGRVRVRLRAGVSRGRVGAFIDQHLVLTDWISLASEDSLQLSTRSSTSSLRIDCGEDQPERPVSLSHGGWDVGWLYSFRGLVLRCGMKPLVLTGLPAGEYWIEAPPATGRSMLVGPGQGEEVLFP